MQVSLGLTSPAFSVSVSLSLSLIGAGWLLYRPLLGLLLLATGLAPQAVPLLRLYTARPARPRP